MQQFKENHHLKRYFTTGLNSQTLLYLLDSSEMKWKLLQIFLLRFQSRCQICQDIRDLSMKPFCFYSFPQIWQLWWETCGTKLMFEWTSLGTFRLSSHERETYIYMAFVGRCFYPKWLTVHLLACVRWELNPWPRRCGHHNRTTWPTGTSEQ